MYICIMWHHIIMSITDYVLLFLLHIPYSLEPRVAHPSPWLIDFLGRERLELTGLTCGFLSALRTGKSCQCLGGPIRTFLSVN